MTQAFNLSQLANRVNTSGQLNIATGATGTLPVANGGTGLTSVGTNGQVLQSNGSSIVWSTISSSASLRMEAFSSSGTWTCPTGVTRIWVEVTSGGTGGVFLTNTGITHGGNAGRSAGGYFTVTPGTNYSYTVSAGGNGFAGSSTDITLTGSTTSFSSFITITAPTRRVFNGGDNVTDGGNTVTGSSFGSGRLSSLEWIGFIDIVRGNLGSTGISWSTSSTLAPGSSGSASSQPGYASGGVGGAIILMYVG